MLSLLTLFTIKLFEQFQVIPQTTEVECVKIFYPPSPMIESTIKETT